MALTQNGQVHAAARTSPSGDGAPAGGRRRHQGRGPGHGQCTPEQRREALEVARAELEASRQEAAELADQLTADLEDAKGQIEALRAAETALQVQIGDLKQTLAAEKASSTMLGHDLDKAREALAELRGSLKTLQEQNAELLKRLPAARK